MHLSGRVFTGSRLQPSPQTTIIAIPLIRWVIPSHQHRWRPKYQTIKSVSFIVACSPMICLRITVANYTGG